MGKKPLPVFFLSSHTHNTSDSRYVRFPPRWSSSPWHQLSIPQFISVWHYLPEDNLLSHRLRTQFSASDTHHKPQVVTCASDWPAINQGSQDLLRTDSLLEWLIELKNTEHRGLYPCGVGVCHPPGMARGSPTQQLSYGGSAVEAQPCHQGWTQPAAQFQASNQGCSLWEPALVLSYLRVNQKSPHWQQEMLLLPLSRRRFRGV